MWKAQDRGATVKVQPRLARRRGQQQLISVKCKLALHKQPINWGHLRWGWTSPFQFNPTCDDVKRLWSMTIYDYSANRRKCLRASNWSFFFRSLQWWPSSSSHITYLHASNTEVRVDWQKNKQRKKSCCWIRSPRCHCSCVYLSPVRMKRLDRFRLLDQFSAFWNNEERVFVSPGR